MLWINILTNIASLSCSTNDRIIEHPVPKLTVIILDRFSAAGQNEGLENSENKLPHNRKRPKDSVACSRAQ